tara:strand:- start:602 stop:1525 length:924 start_codon:yes stop_codon:yes gene_type:complete
MHLISKIQSLADGSGISIIPKNENYFFSKSYNPIGISFLIRTSSKNVFPVDMPKINIDWDSNLEVTIGSKVINDDFIVVTLKSDAYLTQQIFLDVCMNIINNVGQEPVFNDVKTYIEQLKSLFKTNSSKKDEVGLWGELLFIFFSKNTEKAISSWHIDPKDKFDFNDGDRKVEVKTTTLNERIHSFSNNQIIKGKEEDVVILSIMTKELYNGYTISDLKNAIDNKVSQVFKQMLSEKILKAGGDSLDSYHRSYDYKSAIKQSKFYKSNTLNCIEKKYIPEEISKISFKVNFEKYLETDKTKLLIGYL